MSEAGPDALRSLRWAIGHYLWLLVLCVLLITAGIPVLAHLGRSTYKSEVLVVGSQIRTQLVAFPRYGRDIFNSGAVTRQVTRRFGVPADGTPVIPGIASVVTPQDSVVYHVVGHADQAKKAAEIARFTAVVFVSELNKGGIAEFQVASSPSRPQPSDETAVPSAAQLAIGLVAGLALGLGLIMVVLLVRQPVVTPEEAATVSGQPVLTEVSARRLGRNVVRGGPPRAGLASLCRRLLTLDGVETIMVIGPPRRLRERRAVIEEMSLLLEGAKLGEGLHVTDAAPPAASSEPWPAILLVPQGCSAAWLRAAVGELHLAPVMGLLFIRRSALTLGAGR